MRTLLRLTGVRPARPSQAQPVHARGSHQRTPALYGVSCWSNSLGRPILRRVRALGIQSMARGRPITSLAPRVVPGIQALTASPVPKLVPEIQVPLHLPYLHSVSFVYFISRQYGIQVFLRCQAPGSKLAHFRGQETGPSQAPRSVDPVNVSCILYHRHRQSSFGRH